MPWHPTLIDSQILSVHAALMPVGSHGKVLMFGGDEHNGAQGGTDGAPATPANVDRTALFDVGSRNVTRISSPTTDVFCAGHAYLGDGRLLVAGGTESWGGEDDGGPGGGHVHLHGNFGGHRACWIYNCHQEIWQRASDLNFDEGPGKGGGRWYPSVVTLPAGDLAAFNGHPSRNSEHWHENDLPERYSANGNRWFWYPNRIHHEHPSLPGNWYPRVTLITNGWLFFTTQHNGQCRFFDPNTGSLVGPLVGAPGGEYNVGWDYAVLMSPLVAGDNYRSRVLALNGVQPRRLDINLAPNASTPAWENAGTRQGSAAGKQRQFACPTYLPTGQILVTGGIDGRQDAQAVKEPEIYTPDINWSTLTYNAGPGTWQTLPAAEAAQIARNYHTVALLLTDGSVFTASSSKDGNSGDPNVVGQKNIEVFFPSYFNNPARPQLTGAPRSLNYADSSFTATLATAAQAASIRKVALIRCGSVTHAGDFDQRYIALRFVNEAGTERLRVTLPQNPAITPPGYYMLWVVDQNDLPCQLARFVRIAHQSCTVITDHSTFSREQVQAMDAVGDPLFDSALFLQLDGFIPIEAGANPTFTAHWADTNALVPDSDFTIVPGSRMQEINPGFLDTPQRITFAFHVRFPNMNTFGTFADRRQIRVTFRYGQLTASETLDLTHSPNPYLVDVNVGQNNPHWLSTDVRVFSLKTGQSKFGDVLQGGSAVQFIRNCLDKLNDPNNNGSGLFESLSTDATLDLATLAPWPMFLPVFNYAIARVRYRALTTVAQRVKCFFRMFNVQATGLEFDPNTTYRRTAPGPNTTPLLGLAGGEITSIPFFASDRVQTVQGQPGAASMTTQVLDATYEVKDIAPNASGFEVTVYFGCWLDINRTDKRFPIAPGASDGPWPDASCQSIQQLMRGRHMCMVAEVFFEPDPTAAGETPSTSDNLAQRNLAILHSDNPGDPHSHTVMHTFEIKPSLLPSMGQPLGMLAGAPALLNQDHRRFRLDELIFRWRNLPPDSEVTVYFSDIDTAEIQALAAARHSPLACEVVNKHTLKLKVGGATWIPIPGGRKLNIPALLSIKLPDNVTYGQEFRMSVHQVSGRDGHIIGSFEFRIPVSKAELILERETRDLSVLRYILAGIPTDNRWYPLMQRFVHHLGLKVDALGGDSRAVHPNPDGSGRPYDPRDAQQPPDKESPPAGEGAEDRDVFVGRVSEILYDCAGHLSGFVLKSCDEQRRFNACEKGLEELLLRACRDRLQLRVVSSKGSVHSVTVHCC